MIEVQSTANAPVESAAPAVPIVPVVPALLAEPPRAVGDSPPRRRHWRRRARWILGFTIIEMVVTLALVAVAASVVLPLLTVVQTRTKEAELRASLRTIRRALDAYKAAADAGVIDKPTGASGYPARLELLATGVPRASSAGAGALPVVFLRRLPRDPFHEDPSVPAHQTWAVRGYGIASSPGGASGQASSVQAYAGQAYSGPASSGVDVFDVASRSTKTALDGTRYSDW